MFPVPLFPCFQSACFLLGGIIPAPLVGPLFPRRGGGSLELLPMFRSLPLDPVPHNAVTSFVCLAIPAVRDSWAELASQDVVDERLLFCCRPRVGVDVEEEHSVSLYVAYCSEFVGDMFEQHEGCLEVAGFKRFNSVLLRLVINAAKNAFATAIEYS